MSKWNLIIYQRKCTISRMVNVYAYCNDTSIMTCLQFLVKRACREKVLRKLLIKQRINPCVAWYSDQSHCRRSCVSSYTKIGFSLFKSTFESTGKHAFCKRQSLRSTQRCSANMRLTFEAIQNRLYLNTSLFSNNIIGGERNFDSKDNIQTVLLFGIIRAP